jgi:hypothetical protein
MTTFSRYRQSINLAQTSRAYLWAQLVSMVVYLLYFMAYTLPFVSLDTPLFTLAFIVKYTVEAACFVSFSHLLLRPGLKPMLLQGVTRQRLFNFSLQILLAAVAQSILSYLLAHIKLLKSTDMSMLTVHDPAQASSFQMTFSPTFIILTYSSMYLAMYLLWTLAYVLWQNWQARKDLQQQMQQAQLQQLTNQLSPHFLFNAFNSIRALIFEDQQKAADTVTRLSELFRFHLQAHLQPESTLEQEWQLTEQYLAIEQVRLEQRLILKCDIDTRLWQKKLPTLSLLTLVENAIKHGIAPNTAVGELGITAHLQTHGWYLQVSNSVQANTTQAGTGTGLSNLRARMRLMYNDKARLALEQQARHFCARLEFTDV